MVDRKQEYAKKLRDPRWQRRRLEIMERDDFACQACGDETATLHVHHRWYESGQEPWEATNEQLVTLCESCHTEEYAMRGRVDAYAVRALRYLHIEDAVTLVIWLEGTLKVADGRRFTEAFEAFVQDFKI